MHAKTLTLFSYDWDNIEFTRLRSQWPQLHAGFNLFSFPGNARLAWFDMQRFSALAATRAKWLGARGVTSHHEQFGALSAALVAERMGWPGNSVEAVLACQHKLYARQVLEKVAPEANLPFSRLHSEYGGEIPDDIRYPTFVKPVKAAFSVLARQVSSQAELFQHTRFTPWELWVIRHLVEPFEKILRQRLPEAGTAHALMLEQPQSGKQYCLDGYFFDGRCHTLGVVDSIMYPGTNGFMRFDYPSRLSVGMQQQARQVAERFLRAVGFNHGFFNMEFIHDELQGQIKVIEFNPRMASQFSDLYSRVEGINLHEMALAMSHGIDPASLPRKDPVASHASSFVYRSFDPSMPVVQPDKTTLTAFNRQFPDALLFQYPKQPGEIERDFKWLGSYRYAIIHLGGDSLSHLQQRCEQASALLGWPAPYAEAVQELPGLSAGLHNWPDEMNEVSPEKAT